jgi:hypothetical protein
MCLAEGVAAWSAMITLIDPTYFICYFGLGHLINATTPFNPKDVISLNLYLFQFAQYLSLSLNICYFNETSKMLLSPFSSPRFRNYMYYAGSLIMALYYPTITVDRGM